MSRLWRNSKSCRASEINLCLMNCDCKDWSENIDTVNAPIMLAAARSGGRVQYAGKRFTHCPWCGSPLKESEAESVSDRNIASAMGASLENSPSPAPIKEPSEAGTHGLQKDRYGQGVDDACEAVESLLIKRSKGEVDTWGFVATFLNMIEEAKKKLLSEHAPESDTK